MCPLFPPRRLAACRSPSAALSAGLRLWVSRLGALLPLALLAALPGEGLRLLLLLFPQAPPRQALGGALALGLSLLGTAFLTAALLAQVAEPGGLSLRGTLRRGLARTLVVARTQLGLLGLLGLLALPTLPWVLLGLRHSGALGALALPSEPPLPWELPPLRMRAELSALSLAQGALALLAAVMTSYVGLRASLALTAAAADAPGGMLALRRSLRLSRRHLEDLLTFGLLVTAWMLPLLLLLAGTTLVLQPRHFWLGYGVGLFLNLLITLQGQGAAVGLALLYADACAHSGTPTRLSHLSSLPAPR